MCCGGGGHTLTSYILPLHKYSSGGPGMGGTRTTSALFEYSFWFWPCPSLVVVPLLFCAGRPQPAVRWLINGDVVDDQYEHNFGDVIENRLMRPPLYRENLGAIFTCQAVNTLIVKPKESSYVLDMLRKYQLHVRKWATNNNNCCNIIIMLRYLRWICSAVLHWVWVNTKSGLGLTGQGLQRFTGAPFNCSR